MAMDPQNKDRLMQFTTAVKAIIYNPDRMRQFLPLMGTKEGAVQAVQTIMGVIEQKKPIPPDMAPLLGVNTYMLLVDVAQEILDKKPNPEIVRAVIGTIMQTIGQSHTEQGEADQAEQAEMPEDQESPQDEQMEPPQEQQEEAQDGSEMPMGRPGAQPPRGLINQARGA
jgi:hypothetical protein